MPGEMSGPLNQLATEVGRGPGAPHPDLPTRTVSRLLYRQTPESRDALDLPPPGLAAGRYHRKREVPPLYASSERLAAWGELLRHASEPELPPLEIRRRMSRLQVTGLPALDLTDPYVRTELGVTTRQLTGSHSSQIAACRRIADLVRRAPERFGGILAPSAADPEGSETLVVFPEWVEPTVEVLDYRVEPLLASLQRVIERLPAPIRDPLHAGLKELIRRVSKQE